MQILFRLCLYNRTPERSTKDETCWMSALVTEVSKTTQQYTIPFILSIFADDPYKGKEESRSR